MNREVVKIFAGDNKLKIYFNKNIMIINKIVQNLAKNFSAKNNIRPTLASVFFTKNKAVATDAYKLCEIEFLQNEFTQNDLNLKDFEYKKFDESFLINKDDFLKLQIPNIKNPLNKFFIWKNNLWEIELKKFNFTIKTTNYKGEFPDYEHFFQNDKTLEIWVNPEMMIEVMEIYKKAWVRNVKITLWTPLQPLMFEAKDSENALAENDIKQIKSILMPLKL